MGQRKWRPAALEARESYASSFSALLDLFWTPSDYKVFGRVQNVPGMKRQASSRRGACPGARSLIRSFLAPNPRPLDSRLGSLGKGRTTAPAPNSLVPRREGERLREHGVDKITPTEGRGISTHRFCYPYYGKSGKKTRGEDKNVSITWAFRRLSSGHPADDHFREDVSLACLGGRLPDNISDSET